MRVGLGCSILARSRATGHADGIAVYTGALLDRLPAVEPGLELLPVTFGAAWRAAMPVAHALPLPYPAAAVLGAAMGVPFAGSGALAGRIDLFHAPDHYIPRLRGVPVVATIMDVIGLRHPEWVRARLRGLKFALFRRASAWAQHIVTISEFSRRDISELLDIPPERITAIPLGVERRFFDRVPREQVEAVRARHGLDRPYLLFVGTLQPRKNIPRLVAAHAALPDTLRREFPLVIAGQEGWGTEEAMASIRAMQARGDGKWLRYVPASELQPLLQGAHALAFPSLYEGFGLPVLEAFASRLPVLTSDGTSLPEVAGDAAVLVDPFSVEAISDGLRRVIEDGALRAQLVEKGQARASAFSWEETARRTAAVYREHC